LIKTVGGFLLGGNGCFAGVLRCCASLCTCWIPSLRPPSRNLRCDLGVFAPDMIA
jgi:hypothetical protein